MAEHITSQDPPLHTRTRGLLSKLITPKRLKENEDFMWRLADRAARHVPRPRECEFLADYAKPFSLLVIADLLGVPAEDHEEFRAVFARETVGELGEEAPTTHNPLQWLNEKFHAYIEDRRREPRGDVLTELAQAKYEDGSTPDIDDVMNLSTFLFAAGTETTTKLVSSAMRIIGEQPRVRDAVCARTVADPGVPRRDAAAGEPGQVALPAGAHVDDRRRGRRARGHDGHGACQARAIAMRGSSTIPTPSVPTVATCASRSRSSAGCIRVPERHLRGRRAGSR